MDLNLNGFEFVLKWISICSQMGLKFNFGLKFVLAFSL